MKLSMYILERWARNYAPVSNILDGEMELEGVRMLPAAAPVNPRYVYLARNSDFFENGKETQIFLLHKNDIIYFEHEDMENIFNAMEEAFAYYRNLEYRLSLAIHSEQPEQKFVDLCREEFGVAYIMSPQYHILAISEVGEEDGDYLAMWKSLQETRLVPLDRLKERIHVAFYRNINKKVRNLTCYNDLVAPYNYGVMNSYCAKDGSIIGQCLIGFNREIELADFQLLDIFTSFLNKIEYQVEFDHGNYLAEMFFSELIHQRSYTTETLLQIFERKKLAPDTSFCIFACEPISALDASVIHHALFLTGLQQNIYHRCGQAIAVIEDGILICCLPVVSAQGEALIDSILQKIPDIGNGSNIRSGISYPFSDITEASYYCEQAQIALQHGKVQQKNITYIQSCVLDSCVLNQDLKFVRTCQHPLLKVLKEIDAESSSCYYETLKRFLRCGRSYVEVAKQMDVHRNTIVYRMNKILEMDPGLNLEDPDEREYLLFSYRMDSFEEQ